MNTFNWIGNWNMYVPVILTFDSNNEYLNIESFAQFCVYIFFFIH